MLPTMEALFSSSAAMMRVPKYSLLGSTSSMTCSAYRLAAGQGRAGAEGSGRRQAAGAEGAARSS